MDVITGLSYLMGGTMGAAIGSFLGVVIDRTQNSKLKTQKFWQGRSLCLDCGHQLSWWENIPLVSFIFLRGKCRNCRSPIPYWLPLVEIAGAAAGIAIAAMRPMSLMSLMGLMAVAVALIWIFFSDLVYGLVPDWAVLIGSAGAILVKFAKLHTTIEGFANFIWPAAAAAAFFWFLVVVTRGRGMGTGDITLAFFLGLWLGWPTIAIALYLAFILGAVTGITLILLRKKRFGQTIPFGPFMIAGAVISITFPMRELLLDRWLEIVVK